MEKMDWTASDGARRDRLLLALRRPVELVRQRGEYDCGFACLAMVLRTDLDGAIQAVGRQPGTESNSGLLGEEICRVLWDRRLSHVYWSNESLYAAPNPACGHHHGAWRWEMRDLFRGLKLCDVQRHTDEGGTAILGVTNEGSSNGHWIVVAGERVLDPTPGDHAWAEGQTIPVEEAILVREGQ